MAHLLGCDDIHVEYPSKRVFESLTLGVDEGDRIGIVGGNGDGKSTLLRLLSGTTEPDSGRVIRRGGTTVRMLGQADSLDPASTVAACIVGDMDEHLWASDARIRDIISHLVGDIPWEGVVGELSGGQRRRVDLARVLIDQSDVLMLDEPTNHLDV
ncbi:MAG: ATP-binding cassette domain-containing protein, partial [Coriobacteriia bacterium]